MKQIMAIRIAGIAMTLLGCSTSGSVVVSKSIDTGSLETNNPDQPEYTSWIGTRNVSFPDMCEFTITEEGNRITDIENELVQQILEACPRCQIYEIINSPDSVECGDLGNLTTGGTRYRILSFQEQYQDGTLNVRNGPVEVWNAIASDANWQLDYIADAEFDGSADAAEEHTWLYQATSSFQAFRYSENSAFTLLDEP